MVPGVHQLLGGGAVVIEQVAEGRYQAKKLGLCVKLRVGGKLVRQTDLEDNLALDVEGVVFTFKSGRVKPGAKA